MTPLIPSSRVTAWRSPLAWPQNHAFAGHRAQGTGRFSRCDDFDGLLLSFCYDMHLSIFICWYFCLASASDFSSSLLRLAAPAH